MRRPALPDGGRRPDRSQTPARCLRERFTLVEAPPPPGRLFRQQGAGLFLGRSSALQPVPRVQPRRINLNSP
ncbi:hypothetical protein STA1M1_20350 [Sinisalibacter aestuarii]|uniref:Uncharacterized protein n=1 Tax=Sinisalibacter aestuarii TaxID=2949426 RepID=A0ABQ5LV63_9RHOB|nr:hypothetical protein STA1M1_20350 [Sinisalibacter aestuarii]